MLVLKPQWQLGMRVAALLGAAFLILQPGQPGFWSSWLPALALLPAGGLALSRVRRGAPAAVAIGLGLFYASALAAVWSAYHQPAAWQKFGGLVMAGLLFDALASLAPAALWRGAAALGAGGAALAVGFFCWGWDSHPVAGLAAAGLPLLLAGGQRCAQAGRRWPALAAAAAAGVSGLAVIAAGRRLAWLGLAAAGGLWLAGWVVGQVRRRPLPVWAGWLGAGVGAGALGLLVAMFGGPAITELGARLAGQALAWRLAGDYAWVGAGLGAFAGVYSHDMLGLPWLFIPHGYSVYVNVAVEQGAAGLLALGLMWGGSAWRLWRSRTAPPALRSAALASSLILALYATAEDPFYTAWGGAALFMLSGLSLGLSGPPAAARRGPLAGWAVVAAGVALAGGLLWPPARASLYANLGAVRLAQIELAGWSPVEPGPAAAAAELRPAALWLERARRLDPANAAAGWRLGFIASAAQEWERVRDLLAPLQLAGRERPAFRKTLGYALLWLGELEAAGPLLAAIPEAPAELLEYARWWRTQGRPDWAAQAAAMRVWLLTPVGPAPR